jgi:protein tyrosine phosphatase
VPSWVIERQLARSCRPGYGGERGSPVASHTVDAWLDEIKAMGVASIICLLADDQLAYYDSLPDGLLTAYREAGFSIAHVPARDLQQPPLAEVQLEHIWRAYCSLPKPVLVHCSAGVDRTGQAIEHICLRRSAGTDAS